MDLIRHQGQNEQGVNSLTLPIKHSGCGACAHKAPLSCSLRPASCRRDLKQQEDAASKALIGRLLLQRGLFLTLRARVAAQRCNLCSRFLWPRL